MKTVKLLFYLDQLRVHHKNQARRDRPWSWNQRILTFRYYADFLDPLWFLCRPFGNSLIPHHFAANPVRFKTSQHSARNQSDPFPYEKIPIQSRFSYCAFPVFILTSHIPPAYYISNLLMGVPKCLAALTMGAIPEVPALWKILLIDSMIWTMMIFAY